MFNHPEEKSEYSSFERQVSVLREKLLVRCRPMGLEGKAVSGEVFLIYVRCLIKGLWSGKGKVELKEGVYKEVRGRNN